MGLTSGTLALALGLAVAAALAGLLLGWRRLGRPGAGRSRRAPWRCPRCSSACWRWSSCWPTVPWSSTPPGLTCWAPTGPTPPCDPRRWGAPPRPTPCRSSASRPSRSRASPGAVGLLAAVRIHGELSGLTVPAQLYLPPGAAPAAGSSPSPGSSAAAGAGPAGWSRFRSARPSPTAGPGRLTSSRAPVPSGHRFHPPARFRRLALRGAEPGGGGRRADRRGTAAARHPAGPVGRPRAGHAVPG